MLDIRKIKYFIIIGVFTILISSIQSLAYIEDVNKINNKQIITSYLSNRYTQKETNLDKAVSNVTINEDYRKFADSDDLEVYVNEKDLSLRILNKNTNYIWGSSFNTDNEELNDLWKTYVHSGLYIEYFNAKGDNKIETLLTNNKTTIDINYINNGFTSIIKFGVSKIELQFTVSLKNNNLIVEILNDTIKEESGRLRNIRIYPFLGAVKLNNTPGYIFVPDGTGALMRFNNPSSYKTLYLKQVYNRDIGFIDQVSRGTYVRNDEFIYFPTFGMVHGINDNAYITSIDKGSGYASIGVYPAGILTEFNWVYPEFHYRYRFSQPISRKDNIEIIQKDRNNFDIYLAYKFLENEDANYVGMAKAYQKHLASEGLLNKSVKNRENIPLRLELLGLERTKGLFFDKKIEMTSVNEMEDIVNDLNENNIKDLTVVYNGWSKGGLTGTAPNYFPLDKKLGSDNKLEDFIKNFKNDNNDFLLQADYVKAYDKAGGFNVNDLAKKANTLFIPGIDKYYKYSILSPKATKALFTNDLENYKEYNVNIALLNTGNTLFTDFSRGIVNREESKQIYNEMINSFNGNVGLYRANNYMLKDLDYYFDTPVYSSQYVRFDDTVPFIPIVLNGYIEPYSTFSNFFFDTEDELLRMIDFGVYPSFIITNDASHALINTPSEEIYTSKYDDWKNEIIRQYNYVNDALKNVYGQEIISRKVLETGIVKVTYANRQSIIVNYTNNDFNYNGITVNAKNYRNIGD